MSDSKTTIALLAGLAAGAALGVLLAPETGNETRDKLADKLSQSIEELTSVQFDDLVNFFNDKIIPGMKYLLPDTINEDNADILEHPHL